MKKIININPHSILFALAFSMGLGMFKVSFLLLMAAFAVVCGHYREIFGRIKLGGWVLIFLSLLFLCTYSIEYVAYRPDIFSIEPYYFQMLFVLSFCALALPFCFQDEKNYLDLIWSLCLGAFCWAALTILASLLFSNPPYYSRIIDLRALGRGIIQYGNTPGIASLLAFFPIVFFANFILVDSKKSCRFLWVSLFGFCISTIGAILIQQRSFFVIVLILQPILVGSFLYMVGRVRVGLSLLSVIAIYPMMLLINTNIEFLTRKVDAGIFFDARIKMFKFWIEQVLTNPFVVPAVGPPPWDSYQHFHNFFADLHRISGVWALFIVATLIMYIFIRLIYLTYFNKRIGYYLLAVAIPLILIMLSTVVPEGEKQPFLALLLIGSITERCISDMSKPLDLG